MKTEVFVLTERFILPANSWITKMFAFAGGFNAGNLSRNESNEKAEACARYALYFIIENLYIKVASTVRHMNRISTVYIPFIFNLS